MVFVSCINLFGITESLILVVHIKALPSNYGPANCSSRSSKNWVRIISAFNWRMDQLECALLFKIQPHTLARTHTRTCTYTYSCTHINIQIKLFAHNLKPISSKMQRIQPPHAMCTFFLFQFANKPTAAGREGGREWEWEEQKNKIATKTCCIMWIIVSISLYFASSLWCPSPSVSVYVRGVCVPLFNTSKRTQISNKNSIAKTTFNTATNNMIIIPKHVPNDFGRIKKKAHSSKNYMHAKGNHKICYLYGNLISCVFVI